VVFGWRKGANHAADQEGVLTADRDGVLGRVRAMLAEQPDNGSIREQLNIGTNIARRVSKTDDKKLESITDSLFFSFQLFFRRVAREETTQSTRRFDPSRFVLAEVMKHGPIPMSEIGKRMDISKPYMTALVSKLIRERLVERIPDRSDRRVINVVITKAGRDTLKVFKRNARKIVMENLSPLTSDDISALDVSLKNIRSIMSRLNKNQMKKRGRG
jgi:DNA-binding MarR family transcriptional regulator